jgi:AAA+ ATPase superfamily predicted ATPase
MLFDLEPKEEKSELFGRDEQVNELLRLLKSGRWVAVLGPRMVGKTSLIRVVMNELKKEGRKALYANFFGVSSVASATRLLVERINENKSFLEKLKEKVAGTESFSVSKEGVSWTGRGEPTHTLRHVLAGLCDRKSPPLVVFDEVQELYAVAPQLIKVLKNVWDTTSGGILFAFSGSKFGMLHAMERETAMSGRPPAEMRLKAFDEETSKAFLRRGAGEHGRVMTEEQLSEVVADLDGIVGWLTLFGSNYVIQKKSVPDAIRLTVREGRKIVLKEFKNFVKGRDEQVFTAVLRILSPRTEFTWSQVKRAVETIVGRRLNNNSFNRVIGALIDSEYVEESSVEKGASSHRRLRIVDPLVARAFSP